MIEQYIIYIYSIPKVIGMPLIISDFVLELDVGGVVPSPVKTRKR